MKNNLNHIGLDSKKVKAIAKKLNKLLANYQIFYANIRGFHWNIRGDKFFELHAKFEELYDNSQIKIDEIAERILTLGYVPQNAYSDYLKVSSIEEVKGETDGVTAVKNILDSFSKILPLERGLLDLSASADDEGTNALMSDYISEQEKMIWMYRAYLG